MNNLCWYFDLLTRSAGLDSFIINKAVPTGMLTSLWWVCEEAAASDIIKIWMRETKILSSFVKESSDINFGFRRIEVVMPLSWFSP